MGHAWSSVPLVPVSSAAVFPLLMSGGPQEAASGVPELCEDRVCLYSGSSQRGKQRQALSHLCNGRLREVLMGVMQAIAGRLSSE